MANYSLLEKDTRDNWVDGSNIYQKTVVSGPLVVGYQDIPHGIVGMGLLVGIEAMVKINGKWRSLSFASTSALASNIGVVVSDTAIGVNLGGAYAGQEPTEANFTLRYTKA